MCGDLLNVFLQESFPSQSLVLGCVNEFVCQQPQILWPGSETHALAHARRLIGGINERAKARLDWKFEVAFGLLEVFDGLVSTVGAISLGQGY